MQLPIKVSCPASVRFLTDHKGLAPNLILKEALPFSITKETATGLFACRWPGRNHILESDCGRIKYFLDGAHTIESMEACVEWYKRRCPKR